MNDPEISLQLFRHSAGNEPEMVDQQQPLRAGEYVFTLSINSLQALYLADNPTHLLMILQIILISEDYYPPIRRKKEVTLEPSSFPATVSASFTVASDVQEIGVQATLLCGLTGREEQLAADIIDLKISANQTR